MPSSGQTRTALVPDTHAPGRVIPETGSLRQEDCNEFNARLGYIMNPSSKHQSKTYIQIGMVIHNYSLSTWEVEQENLEFKASLAT